MTLPTCLACGGVETRELLDLGSTPALIGSLWDEAGAARAVPRGRMNLVYCRRCAHVWNRAFDPALIDYDADYEASLHFSPSFQSFAEQLARHLVDVHDLRDKHVLEIGSGKGEFLAMLCEEGRNRGTGYDPTYTGRSEHPSVEFVREYFPVGEAPGRQFDLLVCRHVLEHLDEPVAFLRGLVASARASDQAPVMYFEVPSAAFNFGATGLWDCIYPHVSYFCEASLRRLMERAGLEIFRIGEAFHGQFLAAEAVAPDAHASTQQHETDVTGHLAVLDTFAERYRAAVSGWVDRLTEQHRTGARVALWGAGSKGMVFLNAVDTQQRVSSVVDLNPAKWGRYLPGTGHRVDSPQRLGDDGADQILVTNPVYVEEISRQLTVLGLAPEVILI